MCAACAAEYHDPLDRRYHAQTIACGDCGPRLSGSAIEDGRSIARQSQAGKVVAIKGIGGFHLACRADDADGRRARCGGARTGPPSLSR